MTDKQIIIDGVDVSRCLFFTQYGFCTTQLEILGGSGKCSVNNQNCYYKQLKRKEQECEELKNAYTRLNSLYNDNCNFTDKLEQTLTEIKEIAEENFYFLGCYYRFILEKILQKISECEVEDEN